MGLLHISWKLACLPQIYIPNCSIFSIILWNHTIHPYLLGSPTSFCTWRTMVPCFNEETQLMVNSWAKNVMQKEQINVCRLKYTILFHVIEKSVKKNDQRQQKDISSELLNTLIMYREPSDYAFPVPSPVSQHRCCNIYIFTPFVWSYPRRPPISFYWCYEKCMQCCSKIVCWTT